MTPQDLGRAAVARAVDVTLTAVRLPLTIAERITGDRLPLVSGPAQAATLAQAAVLNGFAGVLHDDRLATRAQLLTDAVERARHAAELRARADDLRAHGERVVTDAREEAAARRRRAHHAAEEQREGIEEGAEQAEAEAEERLEAREEQVDAVAERRARAARRATREARRDAVAAESQAVAAEEEALGAVTVVDALDEEVEKAKARRKSSR
jgi:hypothetical protein